MPNESLDFVCHTKNLKWQYAEPKFMENGLCGGLHPPITFFSKNPSIHMKWQKKFERNDDDASVNYNWSLI